jgi:drug/metabolite transporter (DMT)-like permease
MNIILLYSILAITILCTSSPASGYKSIISYPSPILNLWRLEITCLAILPGFIYEAVTYPSKVRELIRGYFYLPLISGFAHSLYVTFWVLSLSQTTLLHSVFFLSVTSTLITFTNLLLGRSVKSSDIAGMFLAATGLCFLLIAVRESTLIMQGSLIALGASFFYSLYWRGGNFALKDKNLPMWSYILIMNLVSGICCFTYSYYFYEDWQVFGWVNKDCLIMILWLGLVPSILANFAYNLILRGLDTYIVTCCVNFNPVVSVIIGVISGYSDLPDITICVGCFVVLCGNMILTLSKDEKKALQGVENASNLFVYSSVVEDIVKVHDTIHYKNPHALSLESELKPEEQVTPASSHLHKDFTIIQNKLAARVRRKKAAYYNSMFGM